MLHTKNHQNRPMLHGFIQKIKVACFLLTHGVYNNRVSVITSATNVQNGL